MSGKDLMYTPLNIDVYTAAFAGAMAGVGVPTGAFIIDPIEADYAPVARVATVYAQAVDTAWGTAGANAYDIECVGIASSNIFARGPGYPIEGDIITQDNWTIVATALVAMIREGDAMATSGGIVFPPFGGGGGTTPPFTTTQELWVASIWGSDTTGDGSIFKPFQTIAHAQSVIPDASSTKLYEIILYPGEYTENVALKAFTKIVGFDPSQATFNLYPANISGDISLGPSFAGDAATAWLTNLEISGLNFHIDFVATGTDTGSVSVTNCNVEPNISVLSGANNVFELHGSTLQGEYLQIGGRGIWENTAGINSGTLLAVKAAVDSGATLQMVDSSWSGDITADQNGNATSGEVVIIEMINSQARNGICTIIAAGSNLPVIDAAYGALPENPVLGGSAVVALSRQMRISLQLEVSAGTGIGGLTTNDVVIPLPSGVIGETSIEDMSCTITPIGSLWGSQASTHNLSWSCYVLQNGTGPSGVSEVHISFYNPNDSPVTLAAAMPFLFYAFMPNIIAFISPAIAAVPLLTAANYAVLSKAGITNVPASDIVGDMGASPITSAAITGFALALDVGGQFSTSSEVTGHVFAANYSPPTPAELTQAVIDMEAAYTNAAGRTPNFTELDGGTLGGQTLVPGVYKWTTAVSISGDITLEGDASSVFIFEITSALTVAGAHTIILSGGVLPENVFWQVGGSTTIGGAANFSGVILCAAAINLGAGAIMTGKCLSQTTVNFNSDTLN